MDYWMPKLNGATACRNIVAKDPTARVILVSAWSPANGIVGYPGALALLAKPVGLSQLSSRLLNSYFFLQPSCNASRVGSSIASVTINPWSAW